jgi:hypothetical protein
MKTLPKPVYWLVCAWAVLCSRQIVAQVVSCPATVSSPSDLSVQLTLINGQTVFRQGEIVGLRVRYASRSPRKYDLDIADRSMRPGGVDLPCLQPDLGTDPLDDYYHLIRAEFMRRILHIPPMAGAVPLRLIGAGPLTIDLELNEWRSLPPGQYRLSILSKRVYLDKVGVSVLVPGQSNWVTFQIVEAEPAWLSSTLSGAVRTLDSPTSTPDEKEHAAGVLRFLDSEDASRELARRFWHFRPGDPGGEDFKFGLYSTPFRQTAIQEMKAILQSSHDATKNWFWFIDVLVNLELQSDPRFRKLLYGTQLADSEGNPGSSYEEEYKRRVSAYKSACELCPELPPELHKDDPIHLPEPPLPKWPPTQ